MRTHSYNPPFAPPCTSFVAQGTEKWRLRGALPPLRSPVSPRCLQQLGHRPLQALPSSVTLLRSPGASLLAPSSFLSSFLSFRPCKAPTWPCEPHAVTPREIAAQCLRDSLARPLQTSPGRVHLAVPVSVIQGLGPSLTWVSCWDWSGCLDVSLCCYPHPQRPNFKFFSSPN